MALVPLHRGVLDTGSVPFMWVNVDHIVSIRRLEQTDGQYYTLVAELKLVGLPLERLPLGAFTEQEQLDERWETFMGGLQPRQPGE